MSAYLDSSVMIAALVVGERHHEACFALLDEPGLHVQSHALAETFSVLTGGRLRYRVPAGLTTELIEESILPWVTVVELSPADVLEALREAEGRGVRGGAVYDYLHLVAARHAEAERIYTLNVSDFRPLHRAGDPEVVHP